MEAVRARLDDHDRRLASLEENHPSILAVEVRELRQDVRDLREEVKANKRAQWALAVSILLGALSVAVSASQIAGTG